MLRGKTTVLFAVIAFLGGGALAATASSDAQPVQVDLNFKDPGVLTDVLVRPGDRVKRVRSSPGSTTARLGPTFRPPRRAWRRPMPACGN
jgi:hypothetical protein